MIEPDPSEELCRDVIFRPFDPNLWLADPQWGIYFTDGRLVEAAAYRRLPSRDLVGQSLHIDAQPGPLPRYNGPCIYAGPVIPHYGHFLTAMLPRLWSIVRDGPPEHPILCHAIEPPGEWFNRPYVRAILSRLGLDVGHFIHLRQPTLLAKVRIPRPALEEQHFVHKVFGVLSRQIGEAFCRSQRVPDRIYLSKSGLRGGTTNQLANEQVIEDCLARHGVKIIHPETLSFGDQVDLLNSAGAISGTIGSGFHTTIFCQEPKRIVGLAYGHAINANFSLMDKIAGNQSTYVYSPLIHSKPWDGVTFGFEADNPEIIAEHLLAALH